MCGAFMAQMGGAAMAKRVIIFFGYMLKNTGIQKSIRLHDYGFRSL